MVSAESRFLERNFQRIIDDRETEKMLSRSYGKTIEYEEKNKITEQRKEGKKEREGNKEYKSNDSSGRKRGETKKGRMVLPNGAK